MSIRTGAIVAVLLAGALVVTVALRGGPRTEALQPRPAAAFVDSIGVNVHTGYADTSYADIGLVIQRLQELGVHHVRDGLPSNPAAVNALRQLGASGIRVDLIAGSLSAEPRTVPNVLRQLGGAAEELEGPNEPDLTGGPTWRARTSSYMSALRGAVGGRGRVAILAPAVPKPSDFASVERLGDGSVKNIHWYPAGGPPESELGDGYHRFAIEPSTDAIQLTETGYTTALHPVQSYAPPVPERIAAIYLVRLLLEEFRIGVKRSYLYELLDEKPDPSSTNAEEHFGLLYPNFAPKPAFTAIGQLTAVATAGLASSSPVPPTVTIRGHGVHALLLRRPNQTLLLAVWSPASLWDQTNRRARTPPAIPMTVTLGHVVPAEVIDPIPGGNAAWIPRASKRITLTVGPDPLLITLG